MINLFIAIPAFGGKVHAEFTRSLLKLTIELSKRNIQHQVEFLTYESLISRGRNTLIAKFYSMWNFTHILFLDSDLIFNPIAIISMIARKKEIIACPYPKKMFNSTKMDQLFQSGYSADEIMNDQLALLSDINYNFLTQDAPEDLDEREQNRGGCYEAKDLPTGCLLIKRSAITALMLYYKDRQYVNNISGGSDSSSDNYFFDLFGTGIVNNIYLSEDYYFCYLARSIGLKCYLETGFTFGHIGSNIFYGNLEQQLEQFGRADGLNLDKNLLLSYNDADKQ